MNNDCNLAERSQKAQSFQGGRWQAINESDEPAGAVQARRSHQSAVFSHCSEAALALTCGLHIA